MPDILFTAAGGLFVAMWALAAGVLIAPRATLPVPVRFTSGAVLVSTAVFALLTAHAGYLLVWLSLGVITIGIAARGSRRGRRLRDGGHAPQGSHLPQMSWWFRTLFACYGAVYLVYVFAPEIQPDAVTYHLGLVWEYVRLHSFSSRVGFYEFLPQGVEMLFVPAFAIGAHSAAKLVHFSFLPATVAMMRHICLELGISDTKACCAAAIFFIAPVAAVTSTSAYTDAALVCCCCSVVWLAIRWDRCRDNSLMLLTGLNAGFCYAIKPTFGWVAVVAFAFFAVRSRNRVGVALFAGAAAAVFLPWIIRSAVLTGNPFAPFLNAWIPNASFTPQLEANLISRYSAFRPSFLWKDAILDYTVLGGNQGTFGPAFLLLPLAGFAVRTKAGRWLIAAALLFAVPVLSNTGTRFLMPAAALASVALMSVLPNAGAIALVGIQILGSANPVIDRYDTRHDWRLGGIPLRAALGFEKRGDYLQRSIPGFANNGLIAALTPEGAEIFAFAPVQQAWLPRDVLVYWNSSLADRIVELLTSAQENTIPVDSRRDVSAFIRRSGYRYILISTENNPFSPIARDLLEHPVQWGVVPAGHTGDVWLFYISAPLN